ncbi:hypothetical protein CDD83_9202 [Cordyceps sp. RAO-2017]|nr:hypothetical protein CDD83_9202 [Cordyceps sp. RAO-2017]
MQATLGARAAHEQSRLRDVLQWAGRDRCADLFNAHLNILWHDELRLASDDALLQPWPLGVMADYLSPAALARPSAVDGLDGAHLPTRELFVDVGPSPAGAGVRMGAGCDAGLQRADELERFLGRFRDALLRLVVSLS